MSFKDNPIVYLTRKVWEYSKGNRHNVVLYFALLTVANTIGLLEPLLVAKILNVVQEQGINSGNILFLLGLTLIFIALTIAFWIFHGPARVIELKNAFLVRANYKKYLLDGTMNLPLEWHTDHHSGDTIDKIEKGTKGLFDYSRDSFMVVEATVRFIGSYIALVYFNLHSSYIMAFMVLIALTIVLRFDSVLRRYYKQLNLAENRISEKIYDAISNITTVIILRIEKLISKEVFKKIMQPFGLFVPKQKINEVKWFLVSLCTSISTFLILFSYIFSHYTSGKTILIGSLYALYGYVRKINDLFFRFAWKYGEIVRQKSRVENAEMIAQDFIEKEKFRKLNLKRWKQLRIKNLTFSYHGKEGDLHLKNLTLRFKRGQKVALVGESGSGKTTFLKLIRGLYKPKYVRVCVDEKCVTGFEAISDEITLIPQDPEIFATTIKENITVGIRRTLKHIKKYTDMACFTPVVKRLPKKWNSSIVEKGVNLSGGEKQRLALSRGLLAAEEHEMVLLDEPTSSVDPKTELKIYKNIFKKFKKKTVISSVHRLHLLRHFDAIYLFKNGEIIAAGPLDALKKHSQEFYKMWEKYHEKKKK